MPLTNAEAAELIDTDEETIEAAVDELGLVNNIIGLDDLDLIDDLLEDDDA
jgi:hypothetical protein